MIEEICYRFGYAPIIDVFGKVNFISLRKILLGYYLDMSVVTSGFTRDYILNLTPDMSYSDFTNKITVTGEEENFIEVLHDEERVASLDGTLGWWCFVNDGNIHYTVRYSEDESKRVRYPRLVVIRSSTSMVMSLAGGISEGISYIDPNDKWCKVQIDGPNLIPELLAGVALIGVAMWIGDGVIAWGGGWTRPVGTAIAFAGSIVVSNVLGSMANFQYEIWGRPVGEVRRSISYSVNDYELQTKNRVCNRK